MALVPMCPWPMPRFLCVVSWNTARWRCGPDGTTVPSCHSCHSCHSWLMRPIPQRCEHMDVGQNGRPWMGPQMLVWFSINHPIIGVPNFDPSPYRFWPIPGRGWIITDFNVTHPVFFLWDKNSQIGNLLVLWKPLPMGCSCKHWNKLG